MVARHASPPKMHPSRNPGHSASAPRLSPPSHSVLHLQGRPSEIIRLLNVNTATLVEQVMRDRFLSSSLEQTDLTGLETDLIIQENVYNHFSIYCICLTSFHYSHVYFFLCYFYPVKWGTRKRRSPTLRYYFKGGKLGDPSLVFSLLNSHGSPTHQILPFQPVSAVNLSVASISRLVTQQTLCTCQVLGLGFQM